MHSMLAKLVSEIQRDWDQKLPAVAFAYRTSVQEATGFTPYFLLHGREARIPADLIYGPPPDFDRSSEPSEFVMRQRDALHEAYELTRLHLGLAARRRKRHYDLRTRPQEYSVGSWVWVYVPRRKGGRYQKWRSLYQGPFRVDKQLGPVNYLVRRNDRSRPWTVHVDKLKPCHQPTDTDEPPQQAEPNPGLNPANSEPTTAGRPRRNVRPPARFRDN